MSIPTSTSVTESAVIDAPLSSVWVGHIAFPFSQLALQDND
jgi:hypothetical protein